MSSDEATNYISNYTQRNNVDIQELKIDNIIVHIKEIIEDKFKETS